MFDKFLSGITQRYEPSVWIMEGNRPCQSPSTFALFEVSEVGDWKGGISRLDLSTQPWGFDRLIMQIKPRLLENYTRRRVIPRLFRVSDFCLAIEFHATSPLLSCIERLVFLSLIINHYFRKLKEIKERERKRQREERDLIIYLSYFQFITFHCIIECNIGLH